MGKNDIEEILRLGNAKVKLLRAQVLKLKTSDKVEILDDLDSAERCLYTLATAPSFEVPFGGTILGAKGVALRDLDTLSLPYRKMSIRFDTELVGSEVRMKAVSLLEQGTLEDLGYSNKGNEDYDEEFIRTIMFASIKEHEWHVPVAGTLIATKRLSFANDGLFRHTGVALFPELMKYMNGGKRPVPPEGFESYLTYPVYELIEALSCSNVEIESVNKVDPEVNKRRIQYGLTPYIETKRLVLKLPKGRAEINRPDDDASNTESHRNSPRQHLRRGHIRRLEDGRKIWINSCVVGDPSRGRITKSYAVSNSGLTHLL